MFFISIETIKKITRYLSYMETFTFSLNNLPNVSSISTNSNS